MNAVIEVLDALGTDGNQVAESLFRRGVNGYVGSVSRCPIANYLTAELDGAWCVTAADAMNLASLESFTVPGAVADFVEAFDAGKYPELQRNYEPVPV